MLHRDLGEVDVPLEEGRVFEINNGVPHRVDNDAERWRIPCRVSGGSSSSRDRSAGTTNCTRATLTRGR